LEGLCRDLVSKILPDPEQYKGILNIYPIFQVNSPANSIALVESHELGDTAREQSPKYLRSLPTSFNSDLKSFISATAYTVSLPPAAQNFLRSFSDSSAGGLVFGKGKGHQRLSSHELLSEFRNHKILCRTQPTALVSVAVNFIDALRRAFEKFVRDDPDQIWIVFISVPYKDNGISSHEKLDRMKQG
jgi:hypothetical protein